MKLKYNLTLQELMDYFCDREYSGFTEHEIQVAEQSMGIALPAAYRSFFLKYGQEDINAVFDNLFCSPQECRTSYQMIHEILEELQEDFETSVRDGEQEEYADNEYFSLWQMPEEEWHRITQNYLLVGVDREGISYTGYLIEDLLDSREDPPVYLSCDDDIIKFKKWNDNTEQFLLEMICESAWENERLEWYDPKERLSVKEIFAYFHVDIDIKQFKVSGHVGTCLDTDDGKLYVYFDYGSFQRLFYVSKEN